MLYSEAYEKAVNQLYFNEDVSDGKMLEEQAARALFYYMYSDEGDYDSIVVRTYKGTVGICISVSRRSGVSLCKKFFM